MKDYYKKRISDAELRLKIKQLNIGVERKPLRKYILLGRYICPHCHSELYVKKFDDIVAGNAVGDSEMTVGGGMARFEYYKCCHCLYEYGYTDDDKSIGEEYGFIQYWKYELKRMGVM